MVRRSELGAFLTIGMWALLGAGCLESVVVRCSDGRLCPATMACDEAHHSCVLPAQLESCAGRAEQADCSYAGVTEGACYEEVCLPSGCGNGMIDPAEVCDDGNRHNRDGCSQDCRSDESCGNGIVDFAVEEACEPVGEMARWCRSTCVPVVCGDGEVDRDVFEYCDDGAANSEQPNAACRPNCQPRRCGDGIVDDGELCDDGNVVPGDGCSADCTSRETCGNGVIDAVKGETCDHGGRPDAYCREECVSARCGDGEVDELEQCDDGEANSTARDAACRPDCQRRRCGDHTTDSDEACDDGNRASGDGCSYDCQSLEVCRNGYRDFDKGEECDDGNALSHDGCSSSCRLEPQRWRRIYEKKPAFDPLVQEPAYDPSCNCFVGLPTFEQGQMWELHGVDWKLVPVPGSQPAARFEFSLVWDGAQRQVLLFGGHDDALVPRDETWAWDGTRFQRLTPRTRSPSPRGEALMVYDAARRRVVLFGGVDSGVAPDLRDTWIWDGSDWHDLGLEITPPPGPDRRMIYDPRRAEPVLYDERTMWRLTEDGWVSTPAPSPLPGGFESFSFVYDTSRQRPVYFKRGKVFEWSGTAWVELARQPPSPQEELTHGSRLRANPVTGQLLLSSGSGRWFQRTHGAWSEHVHAHVGPAERRGAALAYDPLRGETLRFGGMYWSEERDAQDTWIWNGIRFEPGPEKGPDARSGHAMAYDPRARRMVLFGGTDEASRWLGDTWLWDGESWAPVNTENAPTPRAGHAMAFDASRQQLLLYAGSEERDSGAPPLGDLWGWDGHGWSELSGEGAPAERSEASLVYDPRHQRTLMFGGQAPSLFDESTWAWGGRSWQKIVEAGPPYRGAGQLAYDANAGHVVLYGGDTWDENLWSLDPSGVAANAPFVWTEGIGSPRTERVGEDEQMVYEATAARLIVVEPGAADDSSATCVWEIAARDALERAETCRYGFDTDGDELVGCDDPDCWPFCTPLCPPGTECPDDAPRCGDGACNEALETSRMCPGDCPLTALCGDYFCDAGETQLSCPGDCGMAATP